MATPPNSTPLIAITRQILSSKQGSEGIIMSTRSRQSAGTNIIHPLAHRLNIPKTIKAYANVCCSVEPAQINIAPRNEIAKQLATSERSLARRLKAEGTSYNTLFAHVQAERARNFLRNQSLSVSEIAYRLGYTEPAAFSRAFSTWTGISPRDWRRDRVSDL